ncbi:hypothetical protein DH09_15935 [Bacillaceae bacterium JMAK1]|nr:hypothetical protein DH09_15935 [Bacillaceae bacterium JMAK1]
MFKWVPFKEQKHIEKKLLKIMKRLKIKEFDFNWDRAGCTIVFTYGEHDYKMEHSVQKARRKGIILNHGLDCLSELTSSLEMLSEIIDRGNYDLETWIRGMQEPAGITELNVIRSDQTAYGE